MRNILGAAVVVLAWYFCGGLDLWPYDQNAYYVFLGSDKNYDGNLTFSEMIEDFRDYDKNGDGYESRYEYTQHICSTTPTLYELSHMLFDEYDFDNNGILTFSDYKSFFDEMDYDNDTIVMIPEFIDYWVRLFEKYDRYHSGGELQGSCKNITTTP